MEQEDGNFDDYCQRNAQKDDGWTSSNRIDNVACCGSADLRQTN
jgi:hypothetical protein